MNASILESRRMLTELVEAWGLLPEKLGGDVRLTSPNRPLPYLWPGLK